MQLLTIEASALIHEIVPFPGDQSALTFAQIQKIRVSAPGLLALFVAVAEWGVIDCPFADPYKKQWKGPHDWEGKRFGDYKEGGLSIAHFDSSALTRIYEKWGVPRDWSARLREEDFARVHKLERWRRWARALVARSDFQAWALEYWLIHYWLPTGKCLDLAARIANARIRNSRRDKADEWADLPASEQIRKYAHYIGGSRGLERGAKMRRAIILATSEVN